MPERPAEPTGARDESRARRADQTLRVVGPDHPGSVRPAELASVALLECLPEPALADLAGHARRRSFAADEVVFREGDPGDSLHIVTDGSLAVHRPSRYGELVLQRLSSGHAFGELAVFNVAPRSASVTAVEPSSTIELSKVDFDRVLEDHPAAARALLGATASSLTFAKEELARHNQVLETRVRERTHDLHETQLEIVRRLGQAAESRDYDTGRHVTRTSRMCARIGLAAGMTQEEAEVLLNAAPLHDIGKLGIPDRILLKPGRLDNGEWEIMKTHSTIGAELLAGSHSPVVQTAELIALTHHERWDGGGYPRGLSGEQIPMMSRICAVCDVFDALIVQRPYKPAWSLADALAEIRAESGGHFDPRVVDLFLEVLPDLLVIVEETGLRMVASPPASAD